MDAEEEQQGFSRAPGAGEPGDGERATAPLVLSPRPLPDVVFGAPKPPPGAPPEPSVPPPGAEPAAGPGEVTGPQPVVGGLVPPAGRGAHQRRLALLAAVVLAGAAVVAAVAVALWPSGSDGRVRQTAPAAAPSAPGTPPESGTEDAGQGPGAPPRADRSAPPAGDPAGLAGSAEPGGPEGSVPSPAAEQAPSWPVLSGTTPQGVEVTYRTVEVAEGYFEGELRLVNGTGAELPAWTLSFTYPGTSIRNVWGGTFQTDDDGRVVVTGDGNTAPVAPGAWVSVRFGGSGAPSRPQDCAVNGGACGF